MALPRFAFFRGSIVPYSEARVGVLTHALNYGTGCFAGIRAYWNADEQELFVFRPRDHFKRFLESARLMPRLDCQYHWRNEGYRSFDDFLSGFTAEKRKKLRRERRRVAEAGIACRTVKGGELAKSQIDRGADVVYHAAGGTGIGVLRAVADAGKLGIGVDSNQNALHPGKVLTSMLKRVDVAAYNSFKAARDGGWKPGLSVLGLKEEGIDWALDENNKGLISPEMKAAADKAKADIIAGTVKVHDYMSDQKCTM